MKKILLYFTIFFLFFPYANKVFSYSIDFEGTNFYTKISESVEELDKKLYTIELLWEGWTAKKIQNISWVDCLKSNLTEKEVKEISNWNYEPLMKKLKKQCKENWSSISNNLIIKLAESIRLLNIETSYIAKSKSDKIREISKIWIYSDWISENSPFDLMNDIESIDEIIFEKTEKYDYVWDKNMDLSKNLTEELNEKINKWNDEENITNLELILCKINWDCNKKSDLEEFKCEKLGDCEENKWEFYEIIKHKSICSIDESGLKKSSEVVIESSIWKKTNSEWLVTELVEELLKWEKEIETSLALEEKSLDNIKPTWNYNIINDNSNFPCNNFFCIDIIFEKYNHNLLWWWENVSPSIEYLVKRSNNHLKKFTNTSLVQSKMTLNNFELWLKNIDLVNMFHMSIVTYKKPVPILDLNKDFKNWKDKESLEEESMFSLENQLETYYKNYWLDYKRQNDLSIFRKISKEKKSINKSSFWSIKSAYDNIDKYEKYLKEQKEKNDIFRKQIEEITKTSIISDLETQFKELEVFTKSVSYYVENLDVLLDNLLAIPVDTWMN